jgi:hypothetical protein
MRYIADMQTVYLRLLVVLTALGCVHSPVTAAELPGESRVNFRTPERQYQRAEAGDLNIYLEQGLANAGKGVGDKALAKLIRNLHEVFAALPERPASELRRIRFYLMWGVEAPNGGRGSGMAYIRRGEPQNYPHLDSRWNDVIVIYSATNLLYLDSIWTKKALMHELAHAWHISHWADKYEPIYIAYVSAKVGGLYRNVRDRKGKLIPEAYAVHNQLEYFAELSAMYFVGGNYYPFDREGVTDYDKVGERMLRRLWGL